MMPEETPKKKVTKKKELEEVSMEKRQVIQKETKELEKSLNKLKEEMNLEQEEVTAKVKRTAGETKVSDYSILDEIEGINQIFEKYYDLVSQLQKKKERYYSLKRMLNLGNSDNGKPLICSKI
jgi:phenylalanyl-tRNA synthetase alpha subunit